MVLRLLLADQLNAKHSWFKHQSDEILYCLMEVHSETDYAPHHIQKVAALFLAMRNMAQALENAGHRVLYLKLNDAKNQKTFTKNLQWIISDYDIKKIEYQLPDEYRLDIEFQLFEKTLGVPVEAFDTEHFLCTRNELKNFFEGKKTYLMESFYRDMRKRFDVLMQGKEPIGGKWNFDSDNRNAYPKNAQAPDILEFKHDVSDIVLMLEQCQVKTIGSLKDNLLPWPANRKEAWLVLDFFAKNLLENFGKHQDAMHTDIWAGYHSRLSFALNAKILNPLEVVRHCIQEWEQRKEEIELAQVEGFVRQIIGWREYMRGVYWAQMPDYKNLNFFKHQNPLPSWFWNGNTSMNCLSHSVGQSLEKAYAHHIQRLMVIGNFALLAGIHPDELDYWYLGIYIDAYEWVEITNTRGMSQFADGGIVGTKPYVSSANYIQKMSNYCDTCHYNYKEKTGEKACPFNSLYWNFYDKNRALLAKNPRIGMMYRTWDKMSTENKKALLEQASFYLENIEKL